MRILSHCGPNAPLKESMWTISMQRTASEIEFFRSPSTITPMNRGLARSDSEVVEDILFNCQNFDVQNDDTGDALPIDNFERHAPPSREGSLFLNFYDPVSRISRGVGAHTSGTLASFDALRTAVSLLPEDIDLRESHVRPQPSAKLPTIQEDRDDAIYNSNAHREGSTRTLPLPQTQGVSRTPRTPRKGRRSDSPATPTKSYKLSHSSKQIRRSSSQAVSDNSPKTLHRNEDGGEMRLGNDGPLTSDRAELRVSSPRQSLVVYDAAIRSGSPKSRRSRRLAKLAQEQSRMTED